MQTWEWFETRSGTGSLSGLEYRPDSGSLRSGVSRPTPPSASDISDDRNCSEPLSIQQRAPKQIETEMQMKRTILLPATAALLALTFPSVSRLLAQDQPYNSSTATAPNEVAPGTRFLIRLDNELNSKDMKAGHPFTAHTIEPLASAAGTTLPAGAELRGHVDKVEAAGRTGRARMWLTFDDIRTPDGWMPLIAMVDDLPGVHSIRVDYDREGEIEVASSKRQQAFEAAAAGALVGAAAGVASHSEKDAAMGAAVAAATAYMVTSGIGQELTLAKDTKIEIILERSLYFGRS
jgi:hypothetical protein